MTSAIDRRLKKLEGGAGDEVGSVVRQRYAGQPFEEAWREQHGSRPIPPGRAFMLMPRVCETSEQWLTELRGL